MSKLLLKNIIKGFAAVALISSFSAYAEGNRYHLEQRYKSEISPAKSYLVTNYDMGHRYKNERNNERDHDNEHGNDQKPILIDVRTIEEYVGGHPPRAYSIPFPHVYNRQKSAAKGDYIAQAPEDFVAAVNAMDLPKDTLIITMCRTGFRSVLAGNLLADAGYTNVRNMWEGFKGKTKLDESGVEADLNGDGIVDGSNPYSGDLDGWANYQELPVSMKLKNNRLYAPYMSMYYNVPGER